MAKSWAIILFCLFVTWAQQSDAAEKIRAVFPSLATALSPSWVTAEKGLWSKYGLEVELIYLDGGAMSVSSLIGGSSQFLIGSDIAVAIANIQGANLLSLGVTTNSLGYALVTSPSIKGIRDLKGKTLGITRGRDAAYARLAKILYDNGLDPKEDVKLLALGGGPSGRMTALQNDIIQATMLTPPTDLIAQKTGLRILLRVDVPTLAGGLNTSVSWLQKNRALTVNLLKGYIEGVRYLKENRAESLKVFAKYLRNSDPETLAYLYDQIAGRVERDLRPKPESIRFLLDLVALDYPRAQRLTERDHWDLSLLDEIQKSGFIEQIYRK